MILNIRGTHGSGKSWVVHQLLEMGHAPILLDNAVLGYHIPRLGLAIVGRYSNVCGGCDGIKSADEVVARVQQFSQEYKHVVFEGILVSHTFGRYSQLDAELPDFWFLFLNTPLATCISRVKARRLAKGNHKPLNPTNVIKDWHNVWKGVRAKCEEAGHNVKVLDWRDPMPTILEMLCQDKER